MKLQEERPAIVDACLFMQEQALVVGTAGNVSVRVGDLVAISPSGVEYASMTAEDVCVVDMDGNMVEGALKPSSELPLHLSVYKAHPEVNAVTHNHASASTALGLVCKEAVPVSHYYSGMFGGQIRVAPYAMFGTDELADNVTVALEGRSGALMSNHGAITTGPTLAKALSLLEILEYVCDIQLRAMATGAPVKLLSDAELAVATEAMAGYGQTKK